MKPDYEYGAKTAMQNAVDGNEHADSYAHNTLSLSSFIDRMRKVIASNEGSEGTINPDDAGAGISVGVRQWNQKTGELPDLLRAWRDANPQKFRTIFGVYSSELLDEHWVRSINMHQQHGLITAMKKALLDPEYRGVQNNLTRNFIGRTARFAQENGFRSEYAVAAITDAVNQCGLGAVKRGFDMLELERLKQRVGEVRAVERLEEFLARPNGQRRVQNLRKFFSFDRPAPEVIFMKDLLPFSTLV